MLSFNGLGQQGRLGNQMFQYASMKGIARRHGYDFAIPYSPDQSEYTQHKLCTLFELEDGLIIDSPTPRYHFHERMHCFDGELFETCPDGTDLSGYFQSEKYFKHIEDEIRHDFTINYVSRSAFEFVEDLGDYNTVHVRRGDNAQLFNINHHPMPADDWYRRAAETLGGKIVVVSDDIGWCRQQDFFNDLGASFSEGQSLADDLYILKHAKSSAIANSTFSWWGAWLNDNPDKVVYYPPVWFGPALSHLDLKDAWPDDWILL